MPLAVSGHVQQPLICVERTAEWRIHNMIPQIRCGLEEFYGPFAPLEKSLQRFLRVGEARQFYQETARLAGSPVVELIELSRGPSSELPSIGAGKALTEYTSASSE